jgi:hypothetical protein
LKAVAKDVKQAMVTIAAHPFEVGEDLLHVEPP